MEDEIDIVATNEATGDIFFCDSFWEDKGKSVMEKLLEKSEKVEWGGEKRKDHYAVVSRKGFTEEAKGFAKVRKLHLFTLKEMIPLL
jgi:hypothetical protein